MIKSIFYSNSVEAYREYALRLEDNGIDYWATSDCVQLYTLLDQISANVVFIEHNMIEHKFFDVRDYARRNNLNQVILFFNCPGQSGQDQLIKWQDDIGEHYPEQDTTELYNFLLIVAGHKNPEEPEPPPPTRLREPAAAQEPPSPTETAAGNRRAPLEGEERMMAKLLRIRSMHKIGFHELTLLELLYKNPNRMVTIPQMMDEIWQEQAESRVGTIYSYIHNIRAFLRKTDKNATLMRVKKGCYSLVLDGQDTNRADSQRPALG